METLVFGSYGQLGQEIIKANPESIGVSHNNESRDFIDIRKVEEVEKLVKKYDTPIIINAAALANVELCETDHEKAYMTNAIGIKNIAKAASKSLAYLIHVSTDYVFDGTEGNYSENSIPSPVNYYGLSKLVGDAFALSYENSLVIRTSGVFGIKNNFPVYAYKTLKEGKKLNVVDSYYSPIHASLLAKAITHLIDKREKGILNIAGDRISRVGLAEKICEVYGFDRSNINVVPESTMNWKARRPKDSSLDISRAKELIGFDFHSTEANVKELSHSLP